MGDMPLEDMTGGVGTLDYIAIGGYLATLLGIGAWFSREKGDTEVYLLGNRSMSWWVVGVSYMISLLSTMSLVAVPGEVYNHGLTLIIRNFVAPFAIVATFFLFIRFYFKTKVFTPFQYLEERFDVRIRVIASLVFWFSRLTYLSLVLFASAKVFEGASNWPVPLTIIVVGLISIVYTTIGGIRAVIWTDVTQFVVLAFGLGIVFAFALYDVPGGLPGAISYSFENGRGMDEVLDPAFYSFDPHLRITLWVIIIGIIGEAMFYNSSDQIAIQRLLSTSGYQQAKKALYTSVILGLPVACVLWLLGLAIFAFYGHQPEALRPASGDLALFRFIGQQLPSPIPGLILAAMLAAVMSTLDSGINSLATVATKDFYLRLFRRSASEAQQVRFSCRMTIVTGIFATTMGLVISQSSGSMGETMIEAGTIWGAFIGVIAPVFLLGVTTRSVGAVHALVAMVAGWVCTIPMIVWYLVSRYSEGLEPVSFMYVGIPSLVVPLLVGYFLAMFTPKQPRDKIDDLTLFTMH